MKYLGKIYAKGEIVQKDPQEAVKWFKKAADLDDIEAMVYLGVINV